ncbi:MAG: site-specific DNA-methyltransferase [Aquificota bacterium]|nr:MAG: site-specific DNA-methyltransferase [Aquificota bacterium]
MREFPNECIDLIFADPPFNIGIRYDKWKDSLEYEEYLQWSEDWLREAYRVLKKTGSIYVAIGDEFAAELVIIMKRLGLYMRNWIIWYYTFGQHQKKKFTRSHTHILYFTKDKERFTFNSDEIRVPSARQLVYRDRRANPKGRIPDDVWTFPRVCGTFKERVGRHPCQMPEALLERVILASSNPGDIVLDPFGGTGTTAVVAKRLGRNFITIELSETYYSVIIERLRKEEIQGKLFEVYKPLASM